MSVLDQRLKDLKGLVVMYADKYSRAFGVEIDDLIQEGNIAVVKSHRAYRAQGYKFSTYAATAIQRHTLAFARDNSLCVYVPEHAYFQTHIDAQSLQEPLDKNGNPTDLIRDLRSSDSVFQSVEEKDFKEFLLRKIAELPPTEAAIIRARFFEEKSLPAIGKEFGVTGDAIRQREVKGLRLLRTKLRLAGESPTK